MADDATLRGVTKEIRTAFVEAAVTAYEDAAANGLCAEGAWECAVDAMRRVELEDLLALLHQPAAGEVSDQTSSRLPSGSRR